MNISHRSLWNSALGAWVAVSEITRGRGKRSGGGSAVLAGAALLLIGSVPTLGFAQTWTQAGTSDWTNAANWDTGVPGASGAAILNQGTAQINSNTSPNIAVGSLTGSSGTLYFIGTGTSRFTLGADNSNSTFSGFIHGSMGGLTKEGSGVFTLSGGSNHATYAGATNINGGTVRAGANDALSPNSAFVLADVAGVTLDLNNLYQTIGSLAGGGANGGNVNLGNAMLTTGNATSTTYAGVISGTGSLNKMGNGTMTLTGANTYTGGNGVLGGVLQGDSNSLHGKIDLYNNGSVTFDQATAGTYAGVISTSQSATGSVKKIGSGTLTLTGANTYKVATKINAGTLQAGVTNALSRNSAIVLANTADASLNLNNFNQTIGSLAGGGTLGGNVTLGSATLTTSGDNTSTTYDGVIGGTGGLVKAGTGTMTLTGANTYSGGTTVSTGVLQGDTTSLQGDITNNANVTFNQAAAGTYAGVIGGSGSLTKMGSGTLTLTKRNTYTGATNINAGTLQASANWVLPSTSAVVLANMTGATLDLNNTSQMIGSLSGGGAAGGNVTLGTGYLTVNGPNDSTYGGIISGAGKLDKGGSGTLTLTGANSYTGGTGVYSGGLQGDSSSLQGPISTFNAASVTFNQAAAGTYTGNVTGTGSVTKTGDGTLTLAGANNYSGGTTVSSGVLQGDATSLQGNITNNANVTFDLAANGTYAGTMSGTGSLTKTGGNNLTLSSANTYGGGTTLNAGVLAVGNAAALGSGALTVTGVSTLMSNSDLTLANNITLNANLGIGQGAKLTLSGVVSGARDLVKTGSDDLTLSGSNTNSGATTVIYGTLRAGKANALSSSSAVALGSSLSNTLDLNNFDQTIGSLSGGRATFGNVTLGSATLSTGADNTSTTYGGTISGTGGLTKVGSGTMALSGSNTYSGNTTVSAGTLQTNAANVLSASSEITLAAGANLNLKPNLTSFDQTIGSLSGVGNVNLGTSVLTVGGNGNSTTYGGIISGAGALVKTGSGTMTLTGANTYTGGSTVNGGVLQGNTSSLLGNITNNANVTFDQAVAGTYAGAMGGNGSFTKTNSGQLTLSGTNSYSGATSVNAGTLSVNGSNASSAVTVNSGGTLSGSGTVSSTSIASGGTLKGSAGQLLTTGALVLNSGANVDVALGSASNTALFQVNGDLTLGGKLNVSDLGGFGAGVYRIFNYSGGLTDNGFLLGTAPAGSALTVQTAMDKQVNLVNTAGQTLNFWDGSAAANANNGAINGGSGTWTANSGNWTNASGTINAPMTPAPGFAVFQGPAGTVTVDSTQGALAVTGMQFAADGYKLQGDAITLSGQNAIIRVGDGSGNKYTATVSTALTGNAGLEKTDVGTLILTGANSYSGGTTVSGGVLQGNSSSLQGNITNNANVTFDQATAGTYASVISGSGSLNKQGAGTLTLSGANSYSGGTTVSGGVLQGNSSSLQGNISNNANVTFEQATAGTYASVISGSGSLNKQGAGTLTLSGANSYSGGTTVTAGKLQGNTSSLQGNIANNAQVTFDQAAAGTYAGVMSGTGAFDKIGSGTLTLSGINTLSGATSINAGTLTVNGSMANSATTVNNGGTLGGTGTVGNLNVMSGGVLSPGNPMGTLNVNGNATFAAGSTYRVDTNAAGQADRVNVSGNAAINGGKVDVQAAAGTYAANTTYTVLNAAGGRTGTFAGVTSNLAFLTPTLGYDANNVFLTLARNSTSFNDSTIAITPNQGSTSTALQNAATGATGDMSTVLGALTGLSVEQARAAYDSVSGNTLISLRSAGSGFSAAFGNQLQARMGAAQGGAGSGFANSFANRPVLLAANDHVSDLMLPATVSDSPQKFSLAGGAASSNLQSKNDAANGFWLRGNGGYQNTSGDNNAGASKVRSSSLSAGFDTEVREGLRAGVALSSGTSDLSTDVNASGKSRGNAVALYGSYASGPWNFSGSTSLAYGRNHMDRTVTVGAINRVASSDFDSRTLSAYGEATYSLAMTGGWTLQPLAGLSLSRSKADGFTETGAGALNLQVAGQTTTSTKSLLGAKAAFEAGSVRLEPRAIWAHEFGDLNTPMTAQFQGAANASPFQVSGVALKRDTLILGLGASGSMAKNIDLFADVQAEHNARQNNLAVLVGLRARW